MLLLLLLLLPLIADEDFYQLLKKTDLSVRAMFSKLFSLGLFTPGTNFLLPRSTIKSKEKHGKKKYNHVKNGLVMSNKLKTKTSSFVK